MQRILALAAVSTAIAGCGSSSTKKIRTDNFRVVVAGGAPQGGINKLTANKGDQINLDISSNVADEVHVHGYDFKKEVTAGGSVHFGFKATIDGIFVVELEKKSLQIASLVVNA